jgi:hypothetical protein
MPGRQAFAPGMTKGCRGFEARLIGLDKIHLRILQKLKVWASVGFMATFTLGPQCATFGIFVQRECERGCSCNGAPWLYR